MISSKAEIAQFKNERKDRSDSFVRTKSSAIFSAVPLYFLPLLIGEAGSALASCALVDSLYTCSGASSNNKSVSLATSAENPALNVRVDPSFELTNTSTTIPDNRALSLVSAPGHGRISLTQEAGSSLTSVGDGLFISNNGPGATQATLSGMVSSSSGWAVSAEGKDQAGDVTFEQEAGRLEGKGGAAVHSRGMGSLNIRVAAEILGRSDPALLLSTTNTAGDMTISLSPTSLVTSDGRQAGAVTALHGGTGQLVFDLDGAIRSAADAVNSADQSGGQGRGGIKVDGLEGGGSLVLNQAETGSILSSANGILLMNYGRGSSEISTRGRIEARGGYGIYAENKETAGDLTVSSFGPVSSRLVGIATINHAIPTARTEGNTSILIDGNVTSSQVGVHAQHLKTGDLFINQTAGTISGGTGFQGLNANNSGLGATRVNAGGTITGGAAGIQITHTSPGGVSVTQQAGLIRGGSQGIRITNTSAQGGTAVATAGTVNGQTGVEIIHSSPGDVFVTQQAGAITGGAEGVYIAKTGTQGTTSILTAGTITGRVGIQVRHAGPDGVSISQQAGSIEGSIAGLYVDKSGAQGATSISTAGSITATAGQGLRVAHHEGAGDLVIDQIEGTISGDAQSNGIFAYNGGTGATRINTAGTVSGAVGVRVSHFSTGDVSFNQRAGSIQGGLYGVDVINDSAGATSIVIAGDVASDAAANGAAVAAENRGAASSMSIMQRSGKIQGAAIGLSVKHQGLDGNSRVDIFGTIKGGTDSGISVDAINGATIAIHSGAVVSAGGSGVAIREKSTSGGNMVIRNAGSITGDTLLGLGDDTVHLIGGAYFGDIYGDTENTAVAQAASQEGNDAFIWTAGTFAGGFYAQGGSDSAIISAAAYDGAQMLDGGDDTSILDGMTDTLTFKGVSAQSAGANIVNWEIVKLDASTLRLLDGAWAVGMPDEATTGISLVNGSVLDGMAALGLRANVNIDGTSAFVGRGRGRGVYSITGNVSNAGRISTQDGMAGDRVVITGDYVGHGGSFLLDAALSGDLSATDKVEISGSASGTTYVRVENTDGRGGQTLEGIELIRTGGSTHDAFVLHGRVVAGGYEYSLRKGAASPASSNNWYLTSVYNESSPVNTGDGEITRVQRPEAGSYASNLAGANTLFNSRLSDRVGAGWYTNPVTGERHQTHVWIRAVDGHNKGRMSDGQSSYTASRQVLQLGVDVLRGHFSRNDGWHMGVMGGYGQQSSTTRNALSGYQSSGRVNGYSLGLYGTWRQKIDNDSGLYVDGWMLYNWMDNTIKGEQLSAEKYKSKGVTASIEAGYEFLVGSQIRAFGAENDLLVRPQAQLTWAGVKADGHSEINGTQVRGRGNGNVQTRLGIRLSLRSESSDARYQLQPFIEANWLNNTKQYGVRMGNTDSHVAGSRNLGEVKMGVEGQLRNGLRLWVNIAHQEGSRNYRDTTGAIGVKYRF